MPDTQDQILDSAERLIQSQGYSAISYQDISNQVGIRKASIHYYFPSKGDLAAAVVKRYRIKLKVIMDSSMAQRKSDAWGLLDDYFAIYLSFESDPERICLCGALAGEYPVLPKKAQAEVDEFFYDHQVWIRHVIEMGQDNKMIADDQRADYLAGWVLSTLQGALIVGRATNSFERVHEAQEMLRRALKRL